MGLGLGQVRAAWGDGGHQLPGSSAEGAVAVGGWRGGGEGRSGGSYGSGSRGRRWGGTGRLAGEGCGGREVAHGRGDGASSHIIAAIIEHIIKLDVGPCWAYAVKLKAVIRSSGCQGLHTTIPKSRTFWGPYTRSWDLGLGLAAAVFGVVGWHQSMGAAEVQGGEAAAPAPGPWGR